MSLKSELQQIIKGRHGGIVSLQEIEAYCHKVQHKLSNAERRLRPSESPNIERVMKNGAIIGYRFIGFEIKIDVTNEPKEIVWDFTQPEYQQRKLY